MARTGTETNAVTKTFTRADVLAFQVGYVVSATTKSESFEAIAERGIVENEWIEVVEVRGLDKNGSIHAQILMRIDWERHRFHISTGAKNITLDSQLDAGDQVSVAIGKVVRFFNKKVHELGLRPEWLVRYRSGVYDGVADPALGLKDADRAEWASGERVHVHGEQPDLLDELTIDLSVVVPEAPADEKGKRSRGHVKIFFKDKGFGFITPDIGAGDAFVHYSQIEGGGYRILEPGDIVEFDTVQEKRGTRAVNVRVLEKGGRG